MIPLFLIFSLIIPSISAADDTINAYHIIPDGVTLVSTGGMYELGFFSPANSTNRYVGIWYRNIPIQTVLWVANREAPLTTTSGVLRLTDSGILSLFNHTNGTIVWSSNATRTVGNPSAQLLNSGNLVVRSANDDSPENYIWQSFDYPCDTFLVGIQLGRNYVTGLETYLSSWRSETDPAPGEYSMRMDPTGYPQMLLKKGDEVLQRIGPWNGLGWSGAPDTGNDPTYKVMLWMNRNEAKYTEQYDQSVISRSKLSPTGVGQRWTWNDHTNSWTVYTAIPGDNCDNYNFCGPHGSCTVGNSPKCACLDRFVPREAASWNRTDWSSGCVRRTPMNCSEDVFLMYPGIKLPESRNTTFNDRIVQLADCEAECKRNCSCVAYTQLNISGSGSGCLYYHGELIDIRTMAQAGQHLYIRLASAEAPAIVSSSKGRIRVIVIASLMAMILLGLSLVFVLIRKKKMQQARPGSEVAGVFSGHHVIKEGDLPFFSFSTVKQATNHFSIDNKLGEGGFGPVYKGMFEDGQEIAVKRLSKTSSQGIDELKNEVALIAKLQHRNLVRTLGCCVEGEEHMLIYEYMPNRSLDLIIFGELSEF